MLPNVGSNDFAVLRRGVVEDPLDEIVSILIASNVDQRNTGTITASLADSVKIAAQKFGTANLEALLDNLGGKLVSAILSSITDNMINSPATIRRSSMFADMLDAPISELAVSDNVNVGENLFNAGALNSHNY